MKYEHNIDIDASPATVWATLADVPRWPSWTASMESAEWVGDQGLAVGHAARIKQPKLRTATWTVTEVDDGRSFTWDTKAVGCSISASHTIAPRDDGVTVTLSTSVRGLLAPVVGALTAKIGRHYVATEAEGLKRRCESQP